MVTSSLVGTYSQVVDTVCYHCVLQLVGEIDLRNVSSAVADVVQRWKDLGISLGIFLSELNAIFSANPHSPSDCLREMLVLWLKQNYNVRTTHYTMCISWVTAVSYSPQISFNFLVAKSLTKISIPHLLLNLWYSWGLKKLSVI